MRRAVAPLLAVTVALVLADSAVVTLALPDILRHLDTTVGQVAWVLISFNLVLGLGAVPAAVVLRAGCSRGSSAPSASRCSPARSAWCAVAPSIDVLIAARCVQALGGALALVGLPGAAGRGVRRAPRRRDLGHGRRDRHGHRAGRRRAAHRRRSRGRRSSWCRCRSRCWRCRPRSPSHAVPALGAGPAPSGGAAQPDPRPAVGRAHGGAVPAGPAPGRGLAPLAGDGGADRVRRAGRGARRPPARPPPAAAARGRGRGGLLPHRRRAGRPRAPAVGRPRLDDRAAGAGRPRARADRRPAHLAGDGDAPARASSTRAGPSALATSAWSWGWRS